MRSELEVMRTAVNDAMDMLDLPSDLVFKFELGHGAGTLMIFKRVPNPVARPLGELEAAGLLIPLHEMHVYASETAEGLVSRIRAALDDQATPTSDSESPHQAEYRGMKEWWLNTWRHHMPSTNDTGPPPVTKIEATGHDAFLGSTTNQAVYERQHVDDLRELALKRGLAATGEVLEREQLIFLLMGYDAILDERETALRRLREDFARQQNALKRDFERQVEKANAEFVRRAGRLKSDIRRKQAAGEE